jgi:hypothetical protein
VPVMDLPQLHLPEVGAYWFAVTKIPREPELHREFVEACRNEAIRNILNKADIQSADHNLLLEFSLRAASGPRILDLVMKVRTRPISIKHPVIRADVAVGLFLYVLSCMRAADPDEPATLENARKVYGTAGGKYGTYPGLGRSELIEIWDELSPVVHLLAVEKLLSTEWQKQITRNQAPFWTIVLALSERLRLLGDHRPARSKTSLLNSAETWKVPNWVVLPDIPSDWPHLPHPSILRHELQQWPRPRDVHNLADMST